ncbi:hypothetical protein Y032_0099g3213 [Ancylostoma ceylanicum]|nr:hypothetical protein Y032_0099g3213 [Ancylostoma ceylanicum]
MIARSRFLNRSQTGPVPLDSERKPGRSVSASSCQRMDRISSSGSNTPVLVTFVKPQKCDPRTQSQSMDSGLVSLPTSTADKPACSNAPSSSGTSIVQVHEFIFLGHAESAAEIHDVCQNNINYFINVSKKAAKSSMRSSQSCTFLNQIPNTFSSIEAHSYYHGMPLKELFEKFQSVNEIIRQARNKAQRVLIYSEDCFTACQAFALAYNVQYYSLSLDRALDNFERMKMKVELDDYLRDALQKWVKFCEEKKVRLLISMSCGCNLILKASFRRCEMHPPHVAWNGGRQGQPPSIPG